MSANVLEMKDVVKIIGSEEKERRVLINSLSLTVKKREFVIVLGGNGAGKSTLFNLISGNLRLTTGKIKILAKDISQLSEEKRAKYIARVFQDPKMGTAPRMNVNENLLLAMHRGEKMRLQKRQLKQQQKYFMKLLKLTNSGLENHLNTPTGLLSGGQRQALSLLMSTIKNPDLLLLDEHTAALDPKISTQLMELTNKRILENQLTCLMITHQMEDALKYGNRLIVLKKGKVVKDLNAEKKKQLQMDDLLHLFK
ncbi:MAG: ATP-binding cassette domain-containing protein [Streptococcaceae bacterium]|jgi:putative ABC transport system ATP-binding protein|nr:ATP-binding cassette domain-containing protein [Streptococcaceae bacterium]